jgi:signal transduction histidine kinase
MLSMPLAANPLRALVWIEGACFALAFGGDIWFSLTIHFDRGGSLAAWLSPYIPLVTLQAVLVFSIPHAPNRRHLVIAGAIAASCVVALVPSTGISSIVLLAILAARLTFSFGFRGAALTWGAAVAALACDAIAERWGPAHLSVAEILFGMYGIAVQLALIFGIIGVLWLYARAAASAAASAERARIALDLHDSLGHSLTTLTVQLQNAQRLRTSAPERADAYVDSAAAKTAEVLQDVRETVRLLHNDDAAAAPPLPTLLARLHADFVATHAIDVAWHAHLAQEPPGRVAMAVYRVLQEALTNVTRHANAKRVEVRVLGKAGGIDVTVRDDGEGFEQSATSGRGLASMQSRIESIGGTLAIASNAGRGTLVHAHVPVEAVT